MHEHRAQAIRTMLIEQIVAVRPEIAERTVTDRSTLTGDLGMDSVDLAETFERIRDRFGPIDIADWLATATRAEGDTVASLLRYLDGAVPALVPAGSPA
ncbi:acyl carrier protein [Streptomyces hiroshimensis]|uniref:Carrier domain-containing protein n=1 Tax=Streptomyces hiroshimensis TaxID=66424 RepID=A0ABQ2Z5W8_9ACTN|nr:phosphopantetheine-binding protein [Streptomyces hiroshimensis]GGY05630.1 hypothetical protein GCM10010324_60530 [Streptomyces hiroshimensis]